MQLNLQAIQPINPAHEPAFRLNHELIYEHKPNWVKPFGIRVKPALDAIQIKRNMILTNCSSEIPPWSQSAPKVIFDLQNGKKDETNPLTFQSNFNELRSKFKNHVR